jgi:NADH-ubiquinone oxidoreductase chain 5
MYLLMIFILLIGSIFAGLFGRHLGFYGASIITVSCSFISLFLSFFMFYEISLMECFVYIKVCTWINSELLNVDWGFLFDNLTIIMCCMVNFISFFVHLYSIEYMSHDPHLPRFMSYLSLFTFFMLILVTADNYIQMFVGWEGVGLCSYLLINFWYHRIQANKAGIKAMIINRIGDFSLIIGILLLFIYYKSVNYNLVAALTPFMQTSNIIFLNFKMDLVTIIGIFLFIGAVGKSAQLGLHIWLPDAMEGPTPVSALIHAATMVTAGVFLLARSSFIYMYVNSNLLNFIAILGSLTAFIFSSVGLLQNDLKRVIAYSTCSQLGYMIFSCGLSNYSAGIFHLNNHAFFKALLFLSAGSIIHAINDEQDMRKMGGLKKILPFTYSMVIIGSLALIGFPFLTGFYSKDLILELAYGKYNYFGYFCYYLGSIGAFFTAFYSMRLLYLVFLSMPNSQRTVISFAKDNINFITITLLSLSIPSIFIGFYTKDMLVGMGTDFFKISIYIPYNNTNFFDAEFITWFYKSLPVNLSILGFLLAFILYKYQFKLLFKLKISFLGNKIYNFLNRKWFFDKMYNEYFGQFFFKFGYSISYKFIDRGIFEILGPTGLSIFFSQIASNFHKMQSGYLYHFTFSILIGITILLNIRQLCLVFDNYNIDYRILFLFFIASFFLINSNNYYSNK